MSTNFHLAPPSKTEYISPTEIRLTKPYLDGETGVGYSLGPKLVGEPWEVKLPTAINAALLNS